MKKLYISLIFQIAIIFSLFATSNNTIIIDGINNGWDANETFTNCSAADNSYFTWDENFIYIGIADSEADYGNMETSVYFDTDPNGTNGSTLAWAPGEVEDFITTPFNCDWVIVWKNKSGGDYISIKQYNNETDNWDEVAATFNTTLGDSVAFSVGEDYREVKIKRSTIGNPQAIKTCMFTQQQWSPNWRYFVWPSDGWVDAGSTSGQAIPNYYGFLLEDNVVPYSGPYYNANIVSWNGSSDNLWATTENWTGGTPDLNTLVMLPTDATTSVDVTDATCYDITIASGGILTIPNGGDLTITGNLYNKTGSSGLVVESTSSGNGSLIIKGTISGDATVQNHVSAGEWHSWAAPVSGLTSLDLYLGASPEVWLTEYDEETKSYSYISEFDKPLGDMKGWMLWLGESTDHVYNFEGSLRSGTLGSVNNMVRSATGDYGFNYVGNPFPSAIDWISLEGWTKTNINSTIYIYGNGGWSTYNNGASTGSGSQYIAMNQGFFVQVTEGNNTGTLTMNNDVCVHNDVGFLKNNIPEAQGLIRLQLTQNNMVDDAIIRFNSQATEDFDGEYDALKLSSYVTNRPQIYSITNDRLAINTLPPAVETIEVEVKGVDDEEMIISMTEINNLGNVYLKDKLTGIDTDLSFEDYTFIYDKYFTNRFTLHFLITDVDETLLSEIPFIAYSENNSIKIKFEDSDNYSVSIFNLLGQELYQHQNIHSQITISNLNTGYYMIIVSNGTETTIKKIIL